MQQLIKTLQYNGKPIEFEIINGQVFANATAMCQAFGKKPADWLRLATTQRYIDALKAKWENLTSVETRQGGADKGSTWIHEKLILKLAQWLNVDFELWCDEKIAELLRTGEVSIRPRKSRQQKYIQQGKDSKWIGQRVEAVNTRKAFTSTLAQHGVNKDGYRNCTNAIYAPLFGGTTAVVREKKGLDAKTNIRDNLTRTELAAINLAEQLASEEIETGNIRGNAQCELSCTKSSKAVAQAIISAKKSN